MSKNPYIINVIKKYSIVLACFCLWETVFFLILNTLIRDHLCDFDISEKSIHIIMITTNLLMILISIIIDSSIIIKIYKTKSLARVSPIKCLVEDFIINGYTSEGERKYRVFLLLKNNENKELLFSYGKYSLSYYNYTYSKAGQSLEGINIFRKDASSVKIGDEVYVYIKKRINVDVECDNGILKFNNKQFTYRHINKKYDISIFKNVSFYEGAVEVERI